MKPDLFGFAYGLRVYIEPALDIRRPRLERARFSGGVNVTAMERNAARLAEWERERRRLFPKFYVLEDMLIVPPWAESELDKIKGARS